jgi:DNA-binding transcriptional ArsR family regulator
MDDPRVVRLNSRELRVLAHPLRARLLSALRAYGPSTATELARRLGSNSGATSYHLRQLAEVGLIEQDPDLGSGRERWWRAAHDFTSWSETEFLDNADDRAAADWLLGHYVRTISRWVEDWLAHRHEWPVQWRDATDQSDYEFPLNPEGLRALNAELKQVVNRHREAADPTAPGAERVAVILQTFPLPEPRL